MSETTKIGVGRELSSLEVSPQFDSYSGVEVVVDSKTSYFVGNRTGRVLIIENPWGTKAQATNILNALTARGFQYQPFTASGALLNPAAELGDGVTVSDTYSGLYKINRKYGRLMKADISAPQDEEVDHEFPYTPKQERVYTREIAQASAQIRINANSISSEVTRATKAETSLQSSITQNATSINAKVSKTGGTTSSFGWDLTSTSWTLNSSGIEVFKCTKSGVEIKGKVTATSGYIGSSSSGFTIKSTAIYNGVTSLSDTSHNGVYIGTDGIVLGKGKFKVTSAGAVTASDLTIKGGSITLGSKFKVTSKGAVTADSMTLTGTLTIGGKSITAEQLQSGAKSAYDNGSYWSGGAVGGYGFSNATIYGTKSKPTYFYAGTVFANKIETSSIVFSDQTLRLIPKTIDGTYIQYLGTM